MFRLESPGPLPWKYGSGLPCRPISSGRKDSASVPFLEWTSALCFPPATAWKFIIGPTNRENAQEHILSHFLGDGRGELDMASYFYSHQGEDALGHLCRVLSGLDSMVLGETEIFGQVKTAYHTALDAGITAACANKTFQKAFTIGKKVRTGKPDSCRGNLRGIRGSGAGGTNFRGSFRHPRPYSGGGRDEPRYGACPGMPGVLRAFMWPTAPLTVR